MALTRARQRVVITYAGRRRTVNSGGKVVQHLPSRFLSELRSRNEISGGEGAEGGKGRTGRRGSDGGVTTSQNGALFTGMAPQVGSGWIERWGEGGRKVKGGKPEADRLSGGWGGGGREEGRKGAKIVYNDGGGTATDKVGETLAALGRKEIKAKEAMVIFKILLKEKGVKKGSATLADGTKKALSRCTAKELGEYLRGL